MQIKTELFGCSQLSIPYSYKQLSIFSKKEIYLIQIVLAINIMKEHLKMIGQRSAFLVIYNANSIYQTQNYTIMILPSICQISCNMTGFQCRPVPHKAQCRIQALKSRTEDRKILDKQNDTIKQNKGSFHRQRE